VLPAFAADGDITDTKTGTVYQASSYNSNTQAYNTLVNSLIEGTTNQFAYSFGGQQFGFDSYNTAVTALLATPGETPAQAKAAAAKTVTPIVTTTIATVSAVNPTIAVGGTTGFTFANNDGTAATPTGVVYSVTSANASTGFFNGAVFTATAAGSYTIQAAIGTTNLTTTVTVVGGATSVQLSFPSNSSALIANSATNQITVKVADANGNLVSNFNGTLAVSLTNNAVAHHGALNNAFGAAFASGNTINVTNGTGTIYLVSADQASTTADVLTVSALASTNGQSVSSTMSYTPANVTYVAQSASQLKFSPATSTLSNSSAGNSAVLALSVVDSQAKTVNPLNQTTYITLTLNGPGSFTQLTTGSSTPVTSQTVTAASNGTYSVSVYPVVGQTGTITVSAASTGLTSASSTVNLVTAGLVSTYAVTSASGTLNSAGYISLSSPASIPAGTPYTVYTVQFTDVNGNPVAAPASDALTITDNSQGLTGTKGTLVYYAYDSTNTSNPFNAGTLLGTSTGGTTSTTFNATPNGSGKYMFAVFNTTIGASNPTITVTDSGLGLSKTAGFTYAAGSVAKVNTTSAQTLALSLTPGGSTTVSFQLTDGAGNAVAQSGQNVDVWFSTTQTGVTLGASQLAAASQAAGYQATTNAQGIATVTVNASSTASGSFVIAASNLTTGGTTLASPINGNVIALTNAISATGYGTVASSVFTASTQTSLTTTAGNAVSFGSNSIYGINAIGVPVGSTSDILQLTVSNKNILTIGSGWTNASSGLTATTSALTGGVSLPTITANLAGTATITITDISVASQPSVTINVTVTPGAGYTTQFQNNGTTIKSSAPLTLAANTPASLNLMYVDAGGNPVAVTTTPSGITLALSDGGRGGTFSATSGGSPIYQVKIANGSTSATVFYSNPSAGSYSGFSAPTASITSLASVTGFPSTTTTSSAVYAVSATVEDQNGNPFAGATVYVRATGHTNVAINGVTTSGTTPVSVKANASGVISFTYTSGTAGPATDSIVISATSGNSDSAIGSGTLTSGSY